MSEDIKGVFVRLPLSAGQLQKANDAPFNPERKGSAFEASLLAIGTPVMDGELPTEAVRVREHRKDIELPWTYHKTPPSDQDASEYELEFDRLITHKKVIAKLAEKDAEIARLREALDALENANNNLCFMRSKDTYQSMLRDGCEDLLEVLDRARLGAREVLKGGAA